MPTDPPPRRPPSKLAALFDAKLTPTVAALFFVALALMCALAAGIGYITHSIGQTGIRR